MSIDERGAKHDVKVTGGDVWLFARAPLTGTIDIYPGALIAHRIGSKYAEMPLAAAPRSDLVIVGQATNTVRATSATWATDTLVAANTDGDPMKVCIEGDGWLIRGLATGTGINALTANDIDSIVYAYDNSTLYKTDNGGTLSPAGTLSCVDTVTGLCTLDLRAPKAAVIANGSAGAQETPRAVVTTLAANTVTAGVLTYAAVGAFGTQDGVSTLDAGDTVFIQAGTTNLASPSSAGPWEIQTLGTASVIHVMRRPSWWAYGSPIKQSARVRIGGEGTLYGGSTWQSFAANTAVVGTTDPAMYVDQVTQVATLVAGTFTISNVAIRSATKVQLTFARTTPNTSSLTVGGYDPTTITPGALGTASLVYQAKVGAGSINNADISTGLFTVRNF